MKLVIVVGSHRTGTKSLAHYFDRYYQNVRSFHQYSSLRFINVATNLRLAGLISEKSFSYLVKQIMVKHISKNSDRDIYLLSNGFCLTAAKELKKYYEDVRIIHIVRDPRDFLTSYFNFINARWKSKVANSLIPFWHPNGFLVKDMSKKEWKSLSKYEQYAWNWRYKNQLITTLYSQPAEPYLFLKLEELENQETRLSTIQKVVNYAGLDFVDGSEEFFNVRHNKSRGKKLEDWVHWDTAFSQKVNAYFMPLMKEYGYGSEVEWNDKINRNTVE